MAEQLSSVLSENIITLLVFDKESCPLLINNVEVKFFENIFYKTIASKSIEYFKRFNEPPKEHISDLLEEELKTDRGEIYSQILRAIYGNKDTINSRYVLSQLEKFVRAQSLKLSIVEAAELLQSGRVDEAESVIDKSKNKRISVFDPGAFFLKDIERSLSFFDKQENDDVILTGIPYLDENNICPAPGELYVLVARSGVGKSWFMIHLGKFALLQHKKVLHLSLELNEEWVKTRYAQTLFGVMSRDKYRNFNPSLIKDSFDNLSSIEFKDINKPLSTRDENTYEYLTNQIKQIKNPEIIVKHFSSGSLSLQGLKAYLDNLEGYYNFVPDIILLDYLDCMDLDVEKLRIDLAQTAIALRGIAGDRNLAMVTVAQTNRTGEGRSLLTRANLAEDFSKVRVADYLLTYNQTKFELDMGLARLYVDKARNAETGGIILLTQNYSIGQFCLDSVAVKSKTYWDILKPLNGDSPVNKGGNNEEE